MGECLVKYIKYQINNPVNTGTEDSPNWVDNLFQKSIIYSEANEEIAKKEAHNGEYAIKDDGVEEIQEPSWQDKIEAQVTYNSMMLGTLIEEV